jgi:TonB family protein
MKKSLNMYVFVAILVVLQACGPKSDKNNETYATNSTSAASVTAKTLTTAERRAKIAKQKEAQAEKRRIAYETWSKKYPTFTDSYGNTIYSMSEVTPEYVGGKDAMEKYLNDNINYPEESKDNGDEGTVFVDFIIGKDGVVRDVYATDESGYNMDQDLRDEAVRLVASMPRWTPGRQHDKAVEVKYSVPITFQLN